MQHSTVKEVQSVTSVRQIEGVKVGEIVEITKNGEVLINYPGNTIGKLKARFAKSLNLEELQQVATANQEVLLLFENNDPHRPIIIDLLHSMIDDIAESSALDLEMQAPQDVSIDGKTITFDAKEQIVLRCGKASITLTKAGKILIRGAYLLNRSSGVNRIKGGSVQIN